MIIVDKREKNSLVFAELIEKNTEVELKHLKVGDYIIGEIVIERKTISDFTNSMINKRLLKQLGEMKQYPQQILIVEGLKEIDYNFRNIHPNAIRGMLLSVMLDFNIPVVLTRDYEDTGNFLRILEKRVEKKTKQISLKPRKKIYSLQEQRIFVLESFPGIGPNIAKDLLNKFKTVKKVMAASVKQLSKTKLGKKKAEIFKKIIEEEYKEVKRKKLSRI